MINFFSVAVSQQKVRGGVRLTEGAVKKWQIYKRSLLSDQGRPTILNVMILQNTVRGCSLESANWAKTPNP